MLSRLVDHTRSQASMRTLTLRMRTLRYLLHRQRRVCRPPRLQLQLQCLQLKQRRPRSRLSLHHRRPSPSQRRRQT